MKMNYTYTTYSLYNLGQNEEKNIPITDEKFCVFKGYIDCIVLH